jgi:hypothetical protein
LSFWTSIVLFSSRCFGDTVQSPRRVSIKSRAMITVHKHSNFINIPSSQTFRSYSLSLWY